MQRYTEGQPCGSQGGVEWGRIPLDTEKKQNDLQSEDQISEESGNGYRPLTGQVAMILNYRG